MSGSYLNFGLVQWSEVQLIAAPKGKGMMAVLGVVVSYKSE